MTLQDLFVEAYEDTNTSTTNYPYSKALIKFNEIYEEVWRAIVTTQEDYFWTYWTTDLQEWAREYKVEREETTYTDDQWVVHTVPWIAKVKRVVIWTDEDYSYELEQLSDLEESYWLKWWTLKDNHIFLNWTPDKTIEWWLEIQGIQAINNISWNLNEIDVRDAVFPWHSDLKSFYKVIMHGLKAELRDHKQDFEKADRERNRYAEELEKMKRYITQRVQSIYYSDVRK